MRSEQHTSGFAQGTRRTLHPLSSIGRPYGCYYSSNFYTYKIFALEVAGSPCNHSKSLIYKDFMEKSRSSAVLSGHAVIAVAIVGTVVVAVMASPEAAALISPALARMAEAAASMVKP